MDGYIDSRNCHSETCVFRIQDTVEYPHSKDWHSRFTIWNWFWESWILNLESMECSYDPECLNGITWLVPTPRNVTLCMSEPRKITCISTWLCEWGASSVASNISSVLDISIYINLYIYMCVYFGIRWWSAPIFQILTESKRIVPIRNLINFLHNCASLLFYTI